MPEHVRISFRDDVETARACGARSKTHSPLISSRLMQRRACPAPTVGVGHARLFVTTRAKSSLGNVAWFSSHFVGPQAHKSVMKTRFWHIMCFLALTPSFRPCTTSSAEFLDIRRAESSVPPHLGLDIFRALCSDRPWQGWLWSSTMQSVEDWRR